VNLKHNLSVFIHMFGLKINFYKSNIHSFGASKEQGDNFD
jgi:hypothetical protein